VSKTDGGKGRVFDALSIAVKAAKEGGALASLFFIYLLVIFV
jgi:hypothetical protein